MVTESAKDKVKGFGFAGPGSAQCLLNTGPIGGRLWNRIKLYCVLFNSLLHAHNSRWGCPNWYFSILLFLASFFPAKLDRFLGFIYFRMEWTRMQPTEDVFNI
jgi:hypothetical protein